MRFKNIPPYRQGDKVICVDPDSALVMGRKYTVSCCYCLPLGSGIRNWFVRLCETVYPREPDRSFYVNRFRRC